MYEHYLFKTGRTWQSDGSGHILLFLSSARDTQQSTVWNAFAQSSKVGANAATEQQHGMMFSLRKSACVQKIKQWIGHL